MDDALVKIELGSIARITMNNPSRRNALSLEMMRELIAVFEFVSADAQTRIMVLAAEGPVFSAGHDLKEMTQRTDPGFYDELFGVCTELMTLLHHVPQPVIAEVRGVATAAGCQLVASCDLAIAAKDASFATPGVNIGLFCSTPMVPLTRSIGRKHAMEMLLTGEMIPAPIAARWGLVNRVVPADELTAEVMELAERVASASPMTLGIGKRAFYDQVDLDEPRAYEVTRTIMAFNALTHDAQEGMNAFVEKRAPLWQNK
ncbi:MAG: enoyl-CoA hydratase [Acidimicrobiales bacterium]